MRIITLLLILLFNTNHALAKPLISDLSQNEIKIDARFSGTKLFLFGVRNLAGEIVVVIRGPKQNYLVRKKENVLGMWLNRKQMEFQDVYGFYSVYSSVPMSEIEDLVLLNLNIGLENLVFDYNGKAYIEEIDNFKKAILGKKFDHHLYAEEFDKISFMGDALFKTQIEFSKHIPEGSYNAEIYLIDGNNLVGIQSIPISVSKTGFEAAVYNFAHERKVLYGILCVLSAILAGWFANMIFWKV